MRSSLITHFVFVIVVTAIMLSIYATVQQSHRTTANDPQIQVARDIKNDIEMQKPYEPLLPKDTIDISKSLAVFVTIYNKQGDPVSSTGFLDGRLS